MINLKVQEWHKERGTDKASPLVQFVKLVEEVAELGDGLVKEDTEAIKDALGDIQVVLEGLSLITGIGLGDALEFAYDEIKDRTGTVVNGMFVKDAPSPLGGAVVDYDKTNLAITSAGTIILGEGDYDIEKVGRVIESISKEDGVTTIEYTDGSISQWDGERTIYSGGNKPTARLKDSHHTLSSSPRGTVTRLD